MARRSEHSIEENLGEHEHEDLIPPTRVRSAKPGNIGRKLYHDLKETKFVRMALLQALPLSRIFKGSISLALMTVFLIIVVKKVSQAGDEIKEAKEFELQKVLGLCPKLADNVLVRCGQYQCDELGSICDNGFTCCPSTRCNVCVNVHNPCRKSLGCKEAHTHSCSATPIGRCSNPPCQLKVGCNERIEEKDEDEL